MGKQFCRKCGKIISEIDAFCPRCGTPAELSLGPQYIGGRKIASVRMRQGRVRNDRDLLAADRGRSIRSLERETRRSGTKRDTHSGRAGDSKLTHSHTGNMAHSDRAGDAELTHSHAADMTRQPVSGGQGSAGRTQPAPKGKHPVRNIFIVIGVIFLIGRIMLAADDSGLMYVPENDPDTAGYGLYYEGSEAMSRIEYQVYNRYYSYTDLIPSETDPEVLRAERISLYESELDSLEEFENSEIGQEDVQNSFWLYMSGLEQQYYALTKCTPGTDEYDENWSYGCYDRIYAITDLMSQGCIGYDEEIYDRYVEMLDSMEPDENGFWTVPDSML